MSGDCGHLLHGDLLHRLEVIPQVGHHPRQDRSATVYTHGSHRVDKLCHLAADRYHWHTGTDGAHLSLSKRLHFHHHISATNQLSGKPVFVHIFYHNTGFLGPQKLQGSKAKGHSPKSRLNTHDHLC